MNEKIKSAWPLRTILRRLQAAGKKVVFTNGCFDIIHAGHIEYLKKSRSLGDVLVVGLNSDKSVKRIKGKGRPINREGDRANVLASLYFVDYVTLFGETTPYRLIKTLRPDILVKGADWKEDDIVGGAFVKSYGGRLVRIPFVKGYSTSAIIKKIGRPHA